MEKFSDNAHEVGSSGGGDKLPEINDDSDSKKEVSKKIKKRNYKKFKSARFFDTVKGAAEKPDGKEKSEKPKKINIFDQIKPKSDVKEGIEPEKQGLTESELRDSVVVIIDQKEADIREEAEEVETDSTAELSVIADAIFLDALRARVDDDQDFTSKTIDEAYQVTLNDLGIDEVIVAEGVNEREADEVIPLSEHGLEDSSNNLQNIDNVIVPLQQNSNDNNNDGINNSDNDVVQPRIVPTVQPIISVNIPIVTPPNNGGRGNNNNDNNINNNLPPSNPNSFNGNFGAWNSSPSGTINQFLNRSRNVIPMSENFRRNTRGRDLLVGALVGYVIGRRGGRKRTEKRLIPKIAVVEKQLTTLHDAITEKENKIRKLVYSFSENKAPDKPLNTTSIVEKRTYRTEITQKIKAREKILQNSNISKLGAIHLKSAEVFKERRLMDGSENSPSRLPAEKMKLSEILKRAEKLKVGEISVVESYKSGALSESALRIITIKHMRSENFEHTFYRELRTAPALIELSRNKLTTIADSIKHARSETIRPSSVELKEISIKPELERQSDRYRSKVKQMVSVGRYSLAKNSFSSNQELVDNSSDNNVTQKVQKITFPWIVLTITMSIVAAGALLISR